MSNPLKAAQKYREALLTEASQLRDWDEDGGHDRRVLESLLLEVRPEWADGSVPAMGTPEDLFLDHYETVIRDAAGMKTSGFCGKLEKLMDTVGRRWADEGCTTVDRIPAFHAEVDAVLAEIGDMLKAKNRAYGNSALDPIRIFSDAGPVDGLLVRIDDKLSRIKRGHAAGEEVEGDLVGYLVMLRIARRRAGTKP